MKRELERWRDELSAAEDAGLWASLQGALRAHRPRQPAAERRLAPSWRSQPLIMGLSVCAVVIFVGWIALSSRDPAPPVPAPLTARMLDADSLAAGCRAAAARGTFAEELAARASEVAVEAGQAPAALADSSDSSIALPPRPADPGEIRGVVRERATGKPLAPANVLILGTPWGAMTDANGGFVIRHVPPDTYQILVQMMGYEDMVLSDVEVRPGEYPELAAELDAKIVLCLDAAVVKGRKKAIRAIPTGTRHSVTVQYLTVCPRDDVGGGADPEPAYAPPPPAPARRSAGARPSPARFPSGTGGHRTVNGQLADDMFFEHTGTNPFIDPEEDSLSTFGLDVDTGSYTIARRYLEEGHWPPPAAVRVEEFVNFFRKNYPAPAEGDFRIQVEGMPAPFARPGSSDYQLVRIGIRGRVVDTRKRMPAQIVLVIDTSGSMSQEGRLELVKSALDILLDELRTDDEIGIVTYGSCARAALPLTPLTEAGAIRSTLRGLYPYGSTNAEAGLRLGYELLRRAARPDRIHRVILCSDGVANEGQTMGAAILAAIRADTETITLTALGFGMGNYNDVLLEKLADAGDGQYAYIDNLSEAVRVLRENLTGTLQIIARNAKVQVEFDRARVARYRLLGYENRDVRDADFRNNKIDAGEIGAGHEVTALYEIKLRAGAPGGPLATVRLRYERPERGEFVELEQAIASEHLATTADRISPNMLLDAGVAEFAEILRQSYWARESSPAAVLDLLQRLPDEFADRPEVAEFIALVERASAIAPAKASR